MRLQNYKIIMNYELFIMNYFVSLHQNYIKTYGIYRFST